MHIKRTILVVILISIILILALALKRPSGVNGVKRWGVTFSRQFMSSLYPDWKKAYISILDELKPPIVRIPIYWDDVEKEKDKISA